MTDAADNTYPRSLTVLLNAAKEEELRGRHKPTPKDRLLSLEQCRQDLQKHHEPG